ncbi:MAG: hypothetical protein HZA74_07245 [Ignavibacteriales bacterium]|nr:hypothetical protein [Ignavibacteriales bacterium]
MFEREIKFIYDFNLNKVNKLGPYFTFEQLQNADLHPAILHYISAEIDYLVFEDRQKLLKNSVFDYSGEKISYHFAMITEELKKVKRFSLEYIAKLILHSTSFTVNFLVRPKWTLTRFIFDESKHKTTNEIKQILNYVYYYKYLKTIIVTYINSKKILSMNVEEFEELLNKTDRLSLESNFKGVLSNSFISMAEFFNIGQMQKTRIPLTAVELFLEEKDLPNHLQKITEMFGTDENANYHISDYMRVINSVVVEEEVIEDQVEPELNFGQKSNERNIDELYQDDENIYEEKFAVEEEDLSVEDINESENEIKENESDLLTDEEIESVDEIEDEQNVEINKEVSEMVEELTDDELNPIEEENLSNEDYAGFSSKELDELRFGEEENEQKFDTEEDEYQEQNFEQEQEQNENFSFEDDFNLNKEKIEEEYDQEQEFEQAKEENQDKEETITDNQEQLNNEEEDLIDAVGEESQASIKKMELSEIIEHKKVDKIIEVIFDFDFEDFANTIDEVSQCRNIDDALLIINETLDKRKINRNSKEAEALREIISEYFNQ